MFPPMNEWLFPLLAGVVTGVLSGFGVGGGTLLILWLTLAAGMDQRQAGGVNLLYFTACAAPALWGHFKNKLVENRAALWAALAGVPACLAVAALANFLDTALLRRGFGLVLLWVGIFRFDLVAWFCGGQTAAIARIIYTLVGIAALWCITLLFRDRDSTRA